MTGKDDLQLEAISRSQDSGSAPKSPAGAIGGAKPKDARDAARRVWMAFGRKRK